MDDNQGTRLKIREKYYFIRFGIFYTHINAFGAN